MHLERMVAEADDFSARIAECKAIVRALLPAPRPTFAPAASSRSTFSTTVRANPSTCCHTLVFRTPFASCSKPSDSSET